MQNTTPIGFNRYPQRIFRCYYTKEDLNVNQILIDSVREKISTSNEPICKEENADFLIAPIAISFPP
jgi:hypothetical protein